MICVNFLFLEVILNSCIDHKTQICSVISNLEQKAGTMDQTQKNYAATEFQDWVRAEMKIRGWSQATLAERAGFSLSTVAAVLTSGRRKPGMKFLLGIASAFEMQLVDVIVIWKEAGYSEKQVLGEEDSLAPNAKT